MLLVAALAAVPGVLSAACVVSEIMYNPPQGTPYGCIELANDGAEALSIAGWALGSAVSLEFPAGAAIPPGGRAIACADRDAFLGAYPSADPSLVFGPWSGALGSEGDALLVTSSFGAVVEYFAYDDNAPWDFLADGFGPSLERVCLTANPALPENWRAGPPPAAPADFGGTPLAPAAFTQCPPEVRALPALRISEIMYHPVEENDYYDRHEFIEIANAGNAAVNLAGWRLMGGIDFAFPERALEAGQYLVVAFERDALLAVTEYSLDPTAVIGDYGAPAPDGTVRSLDNGGEKVALVAADGVGVDSVSYDDDFPWPVSADALGAGAPWLPAAWLPLSEHQYRGVSLERVSLAWPSNSLANWLPSPINGPTPGRPNSVAAATPLPVVEDIAVRAAEPLAHPDDPLLRAANDARIEIRVSPHGSMANAAVEYFIEDVARTDEPRVSVAATDNGVSPDGTAGDFLFTAVVPRHPDRTIVRYRILADRGAGIEVLSPRPSDPYGWHAYFVSPVIATRTRVYETFISPSNWGRMWTDIQGGRVSGCAASAAWDAEVPAVFVHEGSVYNVSVRYQGSRWNRMNGPDISPARWPYPKPSTGPLKALSWHIKFPRYHALEGLDSVILNKLQQGGSGMTAGAGFRFFEAAGMLVPRQRYVRYHVNGGYIRYMQEMERPGDSMVRRWLDELAALDPATPEREVGHLFKSVGCNCDEGPYGWGDSRSLPASCGWQPLDRYTYTYDPKTHEWDRGRLIMDVIEELTKARAQGTEALRAYFDRYFDVDLLLAYTACINWAVPFDDMFQNHFFYGRRSDGKWFVFPWDLDLDFGFYTGGNGQGPN